MNEQKNARKRPFAGLKDRLGRAAARLRGWVKKRRLICVLILVVLVAAGIFGWGRLRAARQSGGISYSFIRTTTLQKSSLENSVSATGTVASNNVSNVTTSLKYAVKEVFVQVGDTVQAGDVICTLDTESLEKQIQRKQESVADAQQTAQENYDKAVESYNEAVADKDEAWQDWEDAKAEYNSAHDAYYDAQASVGSIQQQYLDAQSALESALELYNSYLKTLGSYNEAENGSEDLGDGSYTDVIRRYYEASLKYSGKAPTVSGFDDSGVDQTYNESNNLSSQWQDAQNTMDLTNLKQAFSTAQDQVDLCETAYETACDKVDTAQESMDTAKKNLEKAGEDDELSDLQDELEECTLVAETSGTVTALNATVGSVCDGTVATIQDTEDLVVDITISEDDVKNVELGMDCKITTDATEDVIQGTLTQVNPTAGENGTFEAQVQVENGSNGLLVGMNASVEIIQSVTEDVYVVPLDAVDEDENGSFVYQQTGGEGVDATFEKLYVTTGQSNDYYVEISGSELQEGMVIRSSADLTQGVETVSGESGSLAPEDGASFEMAGGMPSGGMPAGDMGGSTVIVGGPGGRGGM